MEADLVVVGGGARHGGLLCSAAQRIIRHAPCSVLATAGVARLPGSILCAVDFSDSSAVALEYAAALAAEHGAELTVAHALSFDELAFPRYQIHAGIIEAATREAERRLRKLAEEIGRQSRKPVGWKLLRGRAADALLAAAQDGDFDWLITGSHGRTGLSRAVFGSVAEELVRRADRPILVVRPAPASHP